MGLCKLRKLKAIETWSFALLTSAAMDHFDGVELQPQNGWSIAACSKMAGDA